jgi:hypothetical protein
MRIIDNALPDFAQFQTRILEPGFPWYYARATKASDGYVNPYLYSWVHLVFDDGKWYSQFAQFITTEILSALALANEPVKGLFRVRVILNTISDQPYLNGAHVDFTWPHKTALLYINDADGDTLIYNERWESGVPENLTVARQVAPLANRMVLFDGLQLHTGTTPTKTARRVVLNVNYE